MIGKPIAIAVDARPRNPAYDAYMAGVTVAQDPMELPKKLKASSQVPTLPRAVMNSSTVSSDATADFCRRRAAIRA
jgi:hypothetical protein